MKKHFFKVLKLIICICVWQSSHAQTKPIPIEKIDSHMEKDKKPILMLLSTDWCQYCSMQKLQLQKNTLFIQKADKFYFVDFNAETKKKIIFQHKEYIFKPSGINIGTHELALALNGSPKISYPTWVLLDHTYKPLFRHAGLLNPQQLNELLQVIDATY